MYAITLLWWLISPQSKKRLDTILQTQGFVVCCSKFSFKQNNIARLWRFSYQPARVWQRHRCLSKAIEESGLWPEGSPEPDPACTRDQDSPSSGRHLVVKGCWFTRGNKTSQLRGNDWPECHLDTLRTQSTWTAGQKSYQRHISHIF